MANMAETWSNQALEHAKSGRGENAFFTAMFLAFGGILHGLGVELGKVLLIFPEILCSEGGRMGFLMHERCSLGSETGYAEVRGS